MLIVAGIVSLVALFSLSITGWIVLSRVRYRYHRRRMGIEAPRLSFSGAVADFLGVVRAIVTILGWQVRACCRNGLRSPSAAPAGPAVLCVHGFLMNGAAFWGVRQALAAVSRPTQAVSLGWPPRSIETYSVRLGEALDELCSGVSEASVDIVAHSMGGIVLRHLLATEPRFGRRVRRIVTLGTPHQGTPVSGILPMGPEVRQMGRGSEFLRNLPDFRRSVPQAEVVTVATDRDQVVFPVAASHLPGSRSVTLTGMPHIGLLTDSRAIACVVDLLTHQLPPGGRAERDG